jgi:ComF family protein
MLFSSFSCLLYRWVLPKQCLFCGISLRQRLAICVPCFKDLPSLPDHCPQCARFMPASKASALPCGMCLKNQPDFHKVYALFPYQPPIIHLILKLKFMDRLDYAQTFGELLAERVSLDWYANLPLPDILIPMPLHVQRLRARGFNQALEIARPIARRLKLPLDTTGIERIKPTLPQSGLSALERRKNIKGAFKIKHDYSGKRIAVIDDVVTTGSTINALCASLKHNGAQHIDIWTVARRG